jgi:EH domain-containing protein 1
MVFGRRRRPQFDAGAFDSIVSGVKTIYREKVRPLEEQYLMKDFHFPLLTDDDFDAKPMVLLIGSYSTGKTSFIRYLLEQEFPGMHIGPEPTTDGFQAIFYGAEARTLPGNALVTSPSTPFKGLAQFGNGFLQRFGGCEVPSSFAKCCTLVDTPGTAATRTRRWSSTLHRGWT